MSPTVFGKRTSAALTITLAAATLGAMPPASAAPPSAPVGLNVSQPNVTTTVLSWVPVPDAIRYEVVVDDSADFGTPEVRRTPTNSTLGPEDALPDGTNHWRIRAINSTNESSSWSAGDSFVQGRFEAPQLLSPPNSSALTHPEAPVLTWGLVSGATDYKVEIAREVDFTPATSLIFATKSTSLVPPETLAKGSWFWRVTASRGGGLESDPSAVWTFDIPTLTTPTLVSPPNSTTRAVEDVTLEWTAVPGAKKYEVDVSRDRDFPGAPDGDGAVTMRRVSVVGTAYSPPVTYDNAVAWFWRVRSVDANGNTSDWQTQPSSFRRAWGDVSDAVDDARDMQDIPTLLAPAEAGAEVVDGQFGFSWSPAQHASNYEINVGIDQGFSPGTFNRCEVVGTTYTPRSFRLDLIRANASVLTDDKCTPVPGRINYWRVRALDRPFTKPGVLRGVQGEFSEVQGFYWQPAELTQFSPVNGADVTAPTLRWSEVPGAETYEVEITDASGATVTAKTHSTSYTPISKPLAFKNPYRWTVRALDATGGPVSAIFNDPSMTFNIVAPSPQTTWVNRTVPGATLRAPALQWGDITGADHYLVKVRRDGEGWMAPSATSLIERNLDYAAMTDTSDQLFADGLYHWQVYAYDKEGLSLGSSPEWSFTIAPIGSVTNQELALDAASLSTAETCAAALDPNGVDGPRCNPVPATPVLSWAPVAGASFYQVYVNTDASFTTLMEPESRFPVTSNTMFAPNMGSTVAAYPDNDATANSAYYWAILPCKSKTSCADSIRGELGHATNAFVKKSPAVELVSPLNTSSATASDISFDWADYLKTNRATPAAGSITGEAATQSAMQYRIQVATDPNFQDILESVLVDQSTYTSPNELYPQGPLYWRVRAVDGDENELSWSPTWRVNKLNPLPSLQAPADGDWVSPTTALRWDAMSALEGYQVQVYKNNDISPANLVCATTTSKPARYSAFVCSSPLTPTTIANSSDQYVWRVRRRDASGLDNPWSATRSFEVSAAALELTAPSEGSVQKPNGPVMTWLPVDGADGYRVALRNETTGQNFTPVTTDATAYATTANLDSGSYRWTVTALDVSGGATAEASRTFKVDAGLTWTTATKISAPDGSAVGKTLVSTPPVWSQDGVQNKYQWLRNGSRIFGATSPTYTLTVQDYTKAISLQVTGEKPGYTDGVSVSNQIGATAGGALQSTSQPAISGTAKVGETLIVSNGSWTPAPRSYRYQWLRTGAPIPNATSSRYRLTPEDAGKDVSVTVLASTDGFAEGAASAAAVHVAKMRSTTVATLSTKRIRRGQKVKVGITVTVPGLSAPTGMIKILDGVKTIKRVTLDPFRKGKITVRLPKRKLRKIGRHRIKVVYLGNASIDMSKSKRMRLVVRRR